MFPIDSQQPVGQQPVGQQPSGRSDHLDPVLPNPVLALVLTVALTLTLTLTLMLISRRPALAHKAVHLDAAGDYIEVPHSPSLDQQQFTVELWLRVRETRPTPPPFGFQTVLTKRGEWPAGYALDLVDPFFPFSPGAEVGGNGERIADVVLAGKWYHIAFAQDADSLFIHLNGQLGTAVASTYGAGTTSALRIGEGLDYPDGYFGVRGDVDDVRIWSYARSQAEIAAGMYRHLSGAEPGLSAYWDFENVVGSTVPDLSPNGNDGVIHGKTLSLIESDAPVGFALHAPLGLRAWGEGTAIQLGWKPRDADAAAYNIYRDTDAYFFSDSTNLIATVPATDSTYADATVTAGQDYYYRVRAVDSQGRLSYPTFSAVSRPHPLADDYLTGVFYYPWWGHEPLAHPWEGAYVRDYLVPRQPPWLGHYSCRDPVVVGQQLDWMEEYGIDFISASWWGQDSWENFTLRDHMQPVFSGRPVDFCIFYETGMLGLEGGLIVIDPEHEARLVSDFVYLAGNFFNHANYLRIDGKPVVFLYLSSLLDGQYEQAFAHVRAELQDLGYGLFLIGDEMGPGQPPPGQGAHLRFLDGVTSYILSPWWNVYPIDSGHFADLSHTAVAWQELCRDEGKLFVPDWNPAFNGNTLGEPGDPIMPRRATAGAAATSAYEEGIKVLRPYVDPELKMMMISTWNEWHEDSVIEPTIVAPPTNQDVSGQGHYTHGYYYEGYGMKFLEVTRDLLAPGLATGIGTPDAHPAPAVLELGQNRPNPFNPTTTISYRMDRPARVTVRIYGPGGRAIRTLVDRRQAAGSHRVVWDGRDDRGRPVASGVYYYQLEAGSAAVVRDMVLLR